MFIVVPLQREMVRKSMRSFGRMVAADPAPRSPRHHFQRGVGALIVVGSELAWRPTRFASLAHTMRPTVRRELMIGLHELHAAIPSGRRGRTLAGTLMSASVGAAVVARVRAVRARSQAR
jgi:hypothetical protein